MISLFSVVDVDASSSSETSPIVRLPQDCIRHVTLFCSQTDSSSMYLTCRRWYHSVERILCLADDYYYIPEVSRTQHVDRWMTPKTVLNIENPCLPYVDTVRWRWQVTNKSKQKKRGDVPPSSEVGGGEIETSFNTEFLKLIPRMEKLTTLLIDGIDDHAFQSIISVLQSVGNLRRLIINSRYHTTFTEAGLQGIDRIHALEELGLTKTTVTNVSKLGACKNLKTLRLDSCPRLVDKGVVGLETIPTLESLSLNSTKVNAISQLKACPVLRRLSLDFCSELSDEIVAELGGFFVFGRTVSFKNAIDNCFFLAALSPSNNTTSQRMRPIARSWYHGIGMHTFPH
eukprot:PhF_6_TR10821/c0_g1_i1/m.17447